LERERGDVALLVLARSLPHVGGKQGPVDRRQLRHRFTSLAMRRSWSCVWIARLAISNARWPSIIWAIAVAMSTFEPSSAPCTRSVLRAARAGPEAWVTRN